MRYTAMWRGGAGPIGVCARHFMRFDKPSTSNASHRSEAMTRTGNIQLGGRSASVIDSADCVRPACTHPGDVSSQYSSSALPTHKDSPEFTVRTNKNTSTCDKDRSSCSEHESGESNKQNNDYSALHRDVAYRSLPASMLPKTVPHDFTPFPLPRYDTQLGFGPTRMRDIPDVELAQRRMRTAATTPSAPSTADEHGLLGEESAEAACLHALLSTSSLSSSSPAFSRRVSVDVMDRDDDDLATSRSDDTCDFAKTRSSQRHEDAPVSESTSAKSSLAALSESASMTPLPATCSSAQDDDALTGYRVMSSDVSVMDRLECTRTVEDLLQQFVQRTQREARTATVLDLASILPRCSDAELGRILYELGSLFSPDGRGLNFLVTRVVKYGRSYTVTSELTKAYVHLIHRLTETLVHEQPYRLAHSPALCVRLLHFLALIKVFVPNAWFTHNPNNPSNRGDYTHARGVNKTTALLGTGEELYDYVQYLLTQENHTEDDRYGSLDAAHVNNASRVDGKSDGSGESQATLCMRCSPAQLVDLLAGVAGVLTDVSTHIAGHCHPSGAGAVPGTVLSAILHSFVSHYQLTSTGELRTAADVALVERLYLTLQLVGVQHDALLLTLLADSPARARELRIAFAQAETPLCSPSVSCRRMNPRAGSCTSASTDETNLNTNYLNLPLYIASSLAPSLPRGPNFFAAVAQDRRAVVRQCALELLHRSLSLAQHHTTQEGEDSTTAAAADADANAQVRASDMHASRALCESGSEFLMTLLDRDAAVEFVHTHELDELSLRGFGAAMDAVAEQFGMSRRMNDKQTATSAVQCVAHESSCAGAENDTRSAGAPATTSSLSTSSSSFTQSPPSALPAVRTLLQCHASGYLHAIDHIYLFHSSAVASGSVSRLLSAVRRVPSGKDALLITTRCVRALGVQAQHSVQSATCAAARRALDIIAYEALRGRVILVPLSDELAVHDAGSYCDEDLMLWTMAAWLARAVPLLKVHTLMSTHSLARFPYRHLRSSGRSTPHTRSEDVYRSDTPLLQSLYSKELCALTHVARLQRPVRDRPCTLYHVNPQRAPFLYRRDRALFDRYPVSRRHLAPGFSQGALASDLRGLGYYTPDHPQVPYSTATP